MPIPILMFHSVSDDGAGPVSLPTATFREQMTILADAGVQAVTVSEYVDARSSRRPLPPQTIVMTFDDGYRDFADVVAPLLAEHGWRATVFLPIQPIDRGAPWDCGDGCLREPLTWPSVRDLATTGIEFAAHSLTHRDLTCLPAATMRAEVAQSGAAISQQTGVQVVGFAAPFGRTSPTVVAEVREHYRWCVGTTMDVAGMSDHEDFYDLPRVEMWYFRDPKRWRQFVTRGISPYFRWRRALRAIREVVSS